MTRTPITLTDDQARELVRRVAELEQNHPYNAHSHRNFVKAFLRAVHQITGRVVSPGPARRLLAAFAPTRSASTPTLALEKQALDEELRLASDIGLASLAQHGAVAPAPELDITAQVRRGVAEGLAARDRADSYAIRQCDYLQLRLAEAEKDILALRAQLAANAADLLAARALAERGEAELVRTLADNVRLLDVVAKTTVEAEGNRRFSMQAVDAVRGETREYKERCALLEKELKHARGEVDMYRQLAGQRAPGGPTQPR